MPSSRFDVANPSLEMTIGPDRRIDFDRPVVEATIGGRPVFLVHPDDRRATAEEPHDFMVPITTSRMRRAIDIEYDRAAAPYVPSRLLGFGQDIQAIPETPEMQREREARDLKNILTIYAFAMLPAAGAGALLAYGTRQPKWIAATAGALGAAWAVSLIKGLST